jgi:uncharacterized protein YbjQ (UPF0145 family)
MSVSEPLLIFRCKINKFSAKVAKNTEFEIRNSELFHIFADKTKHLKRTIMILTTTPQIEGRPIREYKGVVTGETIIGANMFKDFLAGIRDIVGGRSGSYEKVLIEAKDISLQEMMQRATALGANAIVGIDIDYETIGANGSMLMVATSGTAVVI